MGKEPDEIESQGRQRATYKIAEVALVRISRLLEAAHEHCYEAMKAQSPDQRSMLAWWASLRPLYQEFRARTAKKIRQDLDVDFGICRRMIATGDARAPDKLLELYTGITDEVLLMNMSLPFAGSDEEGSGRESRGLAGYLNSLKGREKQAEEQPADA